MKKAFATPILQRLARRAGVKVVIEGESFFSPEWAEAIKIRRDPEVAYRYAKGIGFPVIVKPNSLSQGSGVAKVGNKREFMQAVKAICRKDRVFLVQREVKGRDYRVVVLDNEIMSAYERLPLSVRGDGVSTIAQLIQQKQEAFIRASRDTEIKQDDVRITNRLKRLGHNRGTILREGETIALLDNRNLSSDGDIRQPVAKYWVIEINAAPGIDNYASTGREQEKVVEKMYLKVLRAIAKKRPVV